VAGSHSYTTDEELGRFMGELDAIPKAGIPRKGHLGGAY
jgi:hypothetical protein